MITLRHRNNIRHLHLFNHLLALKHEPRRPAGLRPRLGDREQRARLHRGHAQRSFCAAECGFVGELYHTGDAECQVASCEAGVSVCSLVEVPKFAWGVGGLGRAIRCDADTGRDNRLAKWLDAIVAAV